MPGKIICSSEIPCSMKRISSEITQLHKTLFPVLIVGVSVIVLAILVADMVRNKQVNYLAIGFIVLAGVYAFAESKKRITGLVDEVWDDGDAVVIKNGNREARVALSNIRKVRYGGIGNANFVTLQLHEACSLGKEISFVPPRKLLQFTRNPAISELISRIKKTAANGGEKPGT